MLELTGDQCPLLFGKWKPKWKPKTFIDSEAYEISDLSDDNTVRNQTYEFPFAIISLKKEEILPYLISAQALMPSGTNIFDVLFDPRIPEMYSDAKRYLAEEIRKASVKHPELKDINIESHSRFGRVSRFEIMVDYEKLKGGIRNIKKRDALCRKVYNSFIKQLKKEYDVVSQKSYPNIEPGFSVSHGTLEEFELAGGTAFFTELMPPTMDTAGLLYAGVASDEHGKKEFHRGAYNFCSEYINSNFKDILRLYGGEAATMQTAGTGASWEIDLSSIEALRWVTAGALHWRKNKKFSDEEIG